MDIQRLKGLAGVTLTETDTNPMLNEAVVIPADTSIEQLEFMFDAARRAMGFVNKLKNPVDRKKHLSAVFANINKLRAALARAIEAEDAKITQQASVG